jgi:hypothetical protein
MPTVYKYVAKTRLTYFENELLRFTQPGDLNDPYECRPVIEDETIKNLIAGAKVERLSKMSSSMSRKERRMLARRNAIKAPLLSDAELRNNIEQWRQRFHKESEEYANEHIGIFSLSRRWNSSLMWSHYSESHTGICLGFDRLHPYFTKGGVKTNQYTPLIPVTYSEKRIWVSLKDTSFQRSIDAVSTKSSDWAYEEEERLVSVLRLASLKQDREGALPIFLFKVPHEALTEIIVGIKSDHATTHAALSVAEKLGIPVYKCKVSNASFDLERERCVSR